MSNLTPSTQRNVAATTNPVTKYLSTLPSLRSQRTMKDGLRRAAALLNFAGDVESLPWHTVTPSQIAALKATLAQRVPRYSPSTINTTLYAVRGVLKSAWIDNVISIDTYERARLTKGERSEERR